MVLYFPPKVWSRHQWHWREWFLWADPEPSYPASCLLPLDAGSSFFWYQCMKGCLPRTVFGRKHIGLLAILIKPCVLIEEYWWWLELSCHFWGAIGKWTWLVLYSLSTLEGSVISKQGRSVLGKQQMFMRIMTQNWARVYQCPCLAQKRVAHVTVTGYSISLMSYLSFQPFPPGPQIRFSGYAGVSRADGEQGRRHFLPPHQRSVFHYNSPSRHCQMLSLSCSKLKTGVKSDIHL